jgi:hypothetical protein
VKLSDLELTAYDLAAIVLPGCIGLAEIGISARGFTPFWSWSNSISLSTGVILMLAAFGAGHLINQAAYESAMLVGGKRVLYRARDEYWRAHADRIRTKLQLFHQVEIDISEEGASDRAFDISLTIIGSGFGMRKVFTFVSGLSLSLWLLSITATIPILRTFYPYRNDWQIHLLPCASLLLMCAASSILAWRRSQLFLYLADTTVFNIFEVSGLGTQPKADGASDDDAD